MPSLERRRRRLRRLRRLRRPVALGLAAAVVLILLIGGALHAGRASQPYWRDLDRSYAIQVSTVVDQSNDQGATLNRLMDTITQIGRQSLQVQLDALVAQAAASADDAAAMSSPSPSGGVGPAVAAALSARASAVAALRQAVDGLLGLTPLPVPGSATASPAAVPGPLWAPGRASSALARVGSSLVAADRSYAAVRRRLLAAPGHARLPGSVWVVVPAAWSGPSMAGLVAAMTAAGSSLLPVRQLCVLVVGVTPAPVPPPASGSLQPPPGPPPGGGCPGPPAAQGPATVPPTSQLGISVVVANVGSVTQGGVRVGATLRPTGRGAPVSSSRTVSLQPRTSVAVTLPSLRVSSAASYVLQITLNGAGSPSNPSGLAAGPYPITVAPPTPTTTTTTTTTTVPAAPKSGQSSRPRNGGSAGTGTSSHQATSTSTT